MSRPAWIVSDHQALVIAASTDTPIVYHVQRLVETAMLAAVSGLAYALATTMHLEGYLGYFLPLPVILSALRSGPAAGRKTMTATTFLVLGEPSGGFGCGHFLCGDPGADSPSIFGPASSVYNSCCLCVRATAMPQTSLITPSLPAVQLLTLPTPEQDLVCPQCCWAPSRPCPTCSRTV